MTQYVFSNFASGQLLSSANLADLTLTLKAGEGANFPSPVTPEVAALVIEDINANKEIVHLTGRTGDVLTVVRGQEGTAAQNFIADTRVELRVTAGVLRNFDAGTF